MMFHIFDGISLFIAKNNRLYFSYLKGYNINKLLFILYSKIFGIILLSERS